MFSDRTTFSLDSTNVYVFKACQHLNLVHCPGCDAVFCKDCTRVWPAGAAGPEVTWHLTNVEPKPAAE